MKISDFINRNLFPVILLSHFLQGEKKSVFFLSIKAVVQISKSDLNFRENKWFCFAFFMT